MKCKIGVYGSAIDEGKSTKQLALELGEVLGDQKDIILITGAGHGIPYIVAKTAAKKGAYIWGFPPVRDEKSLKEYMPEVNLKVYQKITYIPKSFPLRASISACRVYRNFASTKEADAGIIISGRWGTMNEFTNLYSMGKVIGILEGSGGIANELSVLMNKVNKPGEAKVIVETSPKKLVKKILKELAIIRS